MCGWLCPFGWLQDLMGREAAVAVEQAVARSRIQESGILPTLLGVAALLLGATTVFGQMQLSLNAIWGVAARPNRNSLLLFVKNRLLSLTVVLAIGFVLLVSLLLGVVYERSGRLRLPIALHLWFNLCLYAATMAAMASSGLVAAKNPASKPLTRCSTRYQRSSWVLFSVMSGSPSLSRAPAVSAVRGSLVSVASL